MPHKPRKVEKVERVIRWFDRQTEREAGYAPLRGIGLEELQRLFDVPGDDPMYDCFPIEPRHLSILQPLINHHIDLARYIYYVEADAICVPEPAIAD